MNRCPKCNNTLSSSDVLCPRCGAMVEEINTKVSINNYYADKSNPNISESTTLPDDYENIIMYNESFPMTEQEHPDVQQEQDLVEEPEDFDIEKIISTNGASDHVNPLLAHVKKQQTHVKKEPQQIQEPTEMVEPVSEVDLPPEPEEAADIMDMVPNENTSTGSKEVSQPTSEDSSHPVALNELEKMVKELTQSQDKRQDDSFSIDDTPSYSKLYLEALRNIDITEDENEDSYFDPDAYMEQYRQSKKDKEHINFPMEPEFIKEEEPLRRRYNPNKPKNEKEELLEEIRRIRELSDQEDDSKSDANKLDQEALELDLDPQRFNVPEVMDEQEIEEEQFVVDEDEELQSAQGGFVSTEDYTHEEVKSQETILDKVDSAAKYTPAVKTKKRLPIWAAVLIWIAVAGGVFFGAYTLDNHVKKSYNGYDEYIYEITDGKINLEAIFN